MVAAVGRVGMDAITAEFNRNRLEQQNSPRQIEKTRPRIKLNQKIEWIRLAQTSPTPDLQRLGSLKFNRSIVV
jgi:hypothetical protein